MHGFLVADSIWMKKVCDGMGRAMSESFEKHSLSDKIAKHDAEVKNMQFNILVDTLKMINMKIEFCDMMMDVVGKDLLMGDRKVIEETLRNFVVPDAMWNNATTQIDFVMKFGANADMDVLSGEQKNRIFDAFECVDVGGGGGNMSSVGEGIIRVCMYAGSKYDIGTRNVLEKMHDDIAKIME